MSVLSAKIKLVDNMSDKLKSISTTGREVENQLQSIGTSANSLDLVTTNFLKSSQAMNEASDSVREFNEQNEKNCEIVSSCADRVEDVEDKLNKCGDTFDDTGESAKGLNEGLEDVEDGLKGIGKGLGDTDEETEKYGKTNEEVFGSLNDLIAAAGVVAFLKQVYDGYQECIEAASVYETTVAKVSTLADPNVMSIDELSDDMLDLSKKTGQAASSLADAEYQALSAGVATESATSFVEEANKLAIGGFTQTATAVDVLTTALNAYQMDVSETSHISDVLVKTQNLGKTTVDELASSMGRVIPSAAAYNVQIEDLSTGYAILTANGIATAESTTYLKGMLNELGSSSSEVSTTLKEETGSTFAQLIEDGSSLGDVIGILSDSVDGNTTAFANLWSSQEAGIGALSLLTSGTEKYNSTLEQMKNSAGTVDEAYQTMTSTAEYTSKALETAGTNFKIAVGNTMLPATNKFNEAWTSALNSLTTFVNENPVVVKALAAGTVGLAAATAAVTLYSLRQKIAAVTTLALKAAQDALSGPVGIVIGLLAAGATALTAWALSSDEAAENAEQLTKASQKEADAVEEARVKYEEAAAELGEDYAVTQTYKEELDNLTASYENNKETLGDLVTKNEELKQKYQEHKDNDETETISNQASATQGLVDRLTELASQTNRTASEKAEMLTIIDELNEVFPELSLNYDDIIKKAPQTKEALLELVNQEYDNKLLENAKQNYIDAKALLDEQKEYVEKMNAEMADPYEKYMSSDGNAMAQAEWDEFWNKQITVTDESGEEIKKTWGEVYEESAARLGELQEEVDGYGDEIAELSGITDDGAESTLSASEAAQQAASNVQAELDNLVTAYDEAYEAALESFQNQYSLWDEAPEIVKEATDEENDIVATSASTLMDNLDSQINYWKTYSDNLENLQGRNIEGLNELVASMDDGSEESAAALAGMASASDTELQKIVDKYGTLQEKQDESAKNVGEIQEDFSKKVNQMAEDMKTAIDDMELSDEATASAKKTIDSYVAEINDGVDDAASAAAAVKNAVEKELGTTLSLLGSTISVTPDEGYATGTLSAEPGLALVGEEGPELINFGGGEVVYTAGETSQILNQSFNVADPYASVNDSGKTDVPSGNSYGGERTITIKFEGGGSITVGENDTISKEQIVEVMTEQLKPVLIGILNDEIYEEGDDMHEF